MNGIPVHLLGVDDSGAATTATTDADGRFRQVFAPQQDGSLSAYYNSWEGSPYALGTNTGTPVRVTLAQSETRVTLDAKDVGIKPGQAAKIGGKAEVRNGDGAWKPLPGQITVTTKADGSFSKGFTAKKDGTWMPALPTPDSKHLASSGAEDYVDVR
jgi:hypothetical protein